MPGFELTPEYARDELAWQYSVGGDVSAVTPNITDVEQAAMDFAFHLAEEALNDGNPPVGAVLVVDGGTHIFGAKTHDKVTKNLMGHAELVAYNDAHEVIGDDMSRSTLVTTAVPCTSCTPHLAEGRVAKIIAAAPRRLIFPITGIMRPRAINMHDLLADGNTETTVIMNHQLERSLGLFAMYGQRTGHQQAKIA